MNQSSRPFETLLHRVRLTRRSLLRRLVAIGAATPIIGPLLTARGQERHAAGAAKSAASPIFDPTLDHTYFDFAHLDRVMSLGQSVVAGDAVITMTSLELYQDGFNALLLIEHDDLTSLVRVGAFPVLVVQDDRGRQYHGKMRSGSGGGDRMRVIYSFAPALDPTAESLSFEFRWVKPPVLSSPETGVVYDEANVVDGPWHITIPLNEPSSKGQHSQPGSRLWRVVPVAQRQEVSGYSIALYSLELHDDGFEGMVRIDWDGEFGAGGPGPRMRWLGWDEHGNRYRSYDCPGGGGSPPPYPEGVIRRQSWRAVVMSKPVIGSDVRELTLEIPEIRMIHHAPQSSPEVTETINGPWRFEVQL